MSNRLNNRLIKLCPVCGHRNDPAEITCTGVGEGESVCGYSIWEMVEELDIEGPPPPPIVDQDAESTAPLPPPHPPSDPSPERVCLNGHPLAAEDQICLVCGAEPRPTQPIDPPLPPPPPLAGETLQDLFGSEQVAPDVLRVVLQELDAVLHRLQLQDRSYGDLSPDLVLVLSRQPLQLKPAAKMETGPSAAAGDLSAHIATHVGLYTAPERLIGIEAPRSDWWSLGLLLLQALVGPAFWEGVHERAWQLQVITDGVVLPDTITEPWRTLLTGLLTLDPQERWGHDQVVRWLDGDEDIPIEPGDRTAVQEGSVIRLVGARHRSPARYALAAAQAEAWDEALEQLQQGEMLTWLEESSLPPATLAEVKRLAADETLEPDERLMLVLVLLNPNLPLCLRGEVIGAGTLTANPERARGWLDGVLPTRLRRIERHLWLPELAERRASTLELARTLQLSLEEPRFEAAALIADRRRLERTWAERRKDWPAALHNSLANLISRSRPSDEHLILLLSAELSQFRSAADVLQEAQRLAGSAGVEAQWDEAIARQWLARSQRDVMLALQELLADFVRCGLPEADAWADTFRSDQRLLPEQALVLLAIPPERWERPEGGEHWQRLLQFFRRRVVGGIQRGPLLALSVSARGKRIDLAELVSDSLPADTLINHLVGRQPRARSLDPALLEENPSLNQRLRRLRQEADAYQRDTGITALYLGYPLLVRRDSAGKGATRKPKLLPLLLWPVRLGVTGHGTIPQLAYDKDRTSSDGIRLNPALESVLQLRQTQALQEAIEELQQRSALTGSQVMDVMRTVFPAIEGVLERCPQSPTLPTGCDEQLLPSGVLFLCSFSAQTLAHELEQLERRPSLEGPMAALLRLSPTGSLQPHTISELPEEHERFLVTPADPSQKRAVWASRNTPGVLIQGPPGTGKSQTIVNIVADALGRRERVLVVCQKQAALEVVQNRLEAAGLGGRLCLITDPSSDRRNLLRKLRDDLDSWDANPRRDDLTRERIAIANEISRLERELDALHQALAQPVGSSGLDHRQVIDELLQLGKPAGVASVTALRPLLQDRHVEEVRTIARQCADIAGLWLRAHPENSPLHVLREFSTDEGTINTFSQAFIRLRNAEDARTHHLVGTAHVIESNTPDLMVEWINNSSSTLQSVEGSQLILAVQWFPLFTDQSGNAIRLQLAKLDEEVRSLAIPGSIVKWQSHLEDLNDSKIYKLSESLHRIKVNQTLLASLLRPEFVTFSSARNVAKAMADILRKEETRANELHHISDLEKWSNENSLTIHGLDGNILGLLSCREALSIEHWEKARIRLAELKTSLEQCSPQHAAIEWNISSRSLGDTQITELLAAAKIRRQNMHSFSRILMPSYVRAKATLKRTLPEALLTKDEDRIFSCEQSLHHEVEMRIRRKQLMDFCHDLGIELDTGSSSWEQLCKKIEEISDKIKHILKFLDIVSSCPSRSDVEKALLSGRPDAIKSIFDPKVVSYKREEICKRGIDLLRELSPYSAAEWGESLEKKITSDKSVTRELLEVCLACDESTAAHREILQCLPEFIGEKDSGQMLAFDQALEHEVRMRSFRQRLDSIQHDLGIATDKPVSTTHVEFLAAIAHLQKQFDVCCSIVKSILCCPQRQEAEAALRTGSPECIGALLDQLEGGVKRQVLRQQSLQALDVLSPWCASDWIEVLGHRINRNEPIGGELAAIDTALPCLAAFQLYRKRAAALSPGEQAVMSVLATVRDHWGALQQDLLAESIRITIEREALLGWQAYAEAQEPSLLLSRDEMQGRTCRLQDLDSRLLELNRKLTVIPGAPERVQPRLRWDDIIMLQGPRARKLRELVELGEERGLFELCPVWLANPETVSQIFPLRQGLFDLVIFDEASQLPVENALPAIFRASRLVVSGDEKQLPPTRFFSSGFADDGEEDVIGDDDGEEPELMAEVLASAETRRQVKDCSDLLELAGAAGLAHVSLDIHYRSRYRPLIAHSNAAFYQNKLSVPVLHPAEEIRRTRPLQLEMVNGTYDRQSNQAEAEAVTAFLNTLWCGPGYEGDQALPTLGVVTFNKTQADLIEDELDRLGQKDGRFQEILERERHRRFNGEDCGFFVKNLENVQGDERDVILFSTTFGRDCSGRFRRSFGALGQKGGERRLNVATSRARDKVVIFCSMPLEEISDAHRQRRTPQQPRDFLQSYLLYAAAISAGRLEEAQTLLQRMQTQSSVRKTAADSRSKRFFVQSVEAYLRDEIGLDVVIPSASDAFTFDLALRHPENGMFALGIECDSPRHPDLLHARDREIWRPRVLKSTLPYVHRVWSRLWLIEPERERQRLSDAVRQALPSLATAQ